MTQTQLAEANIIRKAYNLVKSAFESIFPGATSEVVEQSVSMTNIYNQVFSRTLELDGWVWLIDVYADESGDLFAILAQDGLLFRSEISVLETGVELGEMVQVVETFEPIQNGIRITRSADGSVRWFLIAASNVINRNGDIDSSQLFDNLIRRAQDSGEYPYLTFHHLGKAFRMGMTDWVARAENLLLASGLFDSENELADLMIRAYDEDPSYWGSSISFWPLDGRMEEIARDIEIPMYTDGIFEEISILGERNACSLFTALQAKLDRKVNRMNEVLIDEITKLTGGDKAVADKLIEKIDEVNRSIQDLKLVRREASETVQEEPVAEEVSEEVEVLEETEEGTEEQQAVIEIDETLIATIVAQASEEVVAAFQEKVTSLSDSLTALTEKLAQMESAELERSLKMDKRLAGLEADEDAKQRAWTNDLPRNETTRSKVLVRARESADEDVEETKAEIAARTLASIK